MKLNKDRRDTVVNISTLYLKQSILDVVNKRGDDWVKEVLRRINSLIYLVSEEAKYHKACERKFCNQFPSIENRKKGATA